MDYMLIYFSICPLSFIY